MTDAESLDALRQNLELAKEQLKNVDSDIKRVTGRDPTEDRLNRLSRRSADAINQRFGVQTSLNAPTLRRKADDLDAPLVPFKRLVTKDPVVVYSRLDSKYADLDDTESRPPDDDLQVSLASSVVRVGDTRSRLDVTKGLQSSDKERGRRMLGILQGTLNQFRAESAAAGKQPQMERRRQVDAKLEARAVEEKETLRRERTDLFRARRKQQLEVTLIQQKMRMLKAFENWKEETEKMIGFCRSERRPHIFYRPRVENEESKERAEAAAQIITDIIERRRCRLEAEFEIVAKNRRRNMALATSRFENKDGKETKEEKEGEEGEAGADKTIRSEVSLPSGVSKDTSPSSVVNKVKKEGLNIEINRRSADLDSGEVSDASETFALEGDEPLLMDDEQQRHQHPASPTIHPSPSSVSVGKSPAMCNTVSRLGDPAVLREPNSSHSTQELHTSKPDTVSPSASPRTDTRTVHITETTRFDSDMLGNGGD